MTVPPTRPAATVLLLRDEPRGGFSVFMVQRSLQSRFMPGAHVFPGGAVDPGDRGRALDPGRAAAAFGWALDAGEAAAHLVAAARELEEEAGVRWGDPLDFVAFSHWITPAIESRRFDTWFLLGRLPEGSDPRHDEAETIASRWVDPRAATGPEGGLILAPPTFYTLWDLARFDRAEQVLEDARRRSIVPIQPRFQEVEGSMALLLPGDPLHPSERPVEGPTRLVMSEGGSWWVVRGAS